MLSLFKKIIWIFLVSVPITQTVFALEINQTNYETYIGDIGGDGDGDYYFKQKPWTLFYMAT